MISLDLLRAFGWGEFVDFLFLLLLMDVPRYLLAALILAMLPPPQRARLDESTSGELARATDSALRVRNGAAAEFTTDVVKTVCGLVACHNEEHAIAACVASMRLNGIGRIVVVNDGSSDRTHEVLRSLGVVVIDLADRIGKPNALNVGLPSCQGDLVLVADADTFFAPGAVANAAAYFEPRVAGVGFCLAVANERDSLITRYQAIEYAIAFTAGRRVADAFNVLPNVSGAAGLFRRDALFAVGGFECEVADDAALAMKLRVNGWGLRYAVDAVATTEVPDTITDLLMQRLRWDAGIATVWWFKFRSVFNPFSARFSVSNLLTSLDVVVFGMVLPLILPVYVFWLWGKAEQSALILLGAVMIALAVVDVIILLLVRVPARLLLYVPFFIVTETLVMRPLRVIALVGELCFSITRYDPYIPREQRDRLT